MPQSHKLENLQQVGRLAMRVEGENWNAYYALPDTMEGAIYLGSIAMGAIVGSERNEWRKEIFMGMMRDVVADLIEESTGVRPEWNEPQPAPDRDRTIKA